MEGGVGVDSAWRTGWLDEREGWGRAVDWTDFGEGVSVGVVARRLVWAAMGCADSLLEAISGWGVGSGTRVGLADDSGVRSVRFRVVARLSALLSASSGIREGLSRRAISRSLVRPVAMELEGDDAELAEADSLAIIRSDLLAEDFSAGAAASLLAGLAADSTLAGVELEGDVPVSLRRRSDRLLSKRGTVFDVADSRREGVDSLRVSLR
jgi:hypothetical protein